jgi:DNA-binding HxlR family transcriptional regulator
MGSSYHQFCPVAKAMELLDERWTLLIIRELVTGSQRFNDLRRGLPRISPTLLSRRLQQLVRAGILERRPDGNEVRYVLTPAGQELRPVVEALGVWGIRWIGHLGDEDLDPKLLMWDMHRNIDHSVLPEGRTVVNFRFSDVPVKARSWWLVITSDEADVCDVDPGYPVAVTVTASLRHMIEVWRGDVGWSEALRSSAVEVQGPEALRRALPGWFTLLPFALVPRPASPTTRRAAAGHLDTLTS